MEGGGFTGIGVATLKPGDPLEYQFRDGGILADHDEDRGHFDTRTLPALKFAFVMAIESVERGFECVGQSKRAELGGTGGGFGQILADFFPQIAVDDPIGLHQIVGDRHAREFDDAALDGVNQAEIRDDPGEEIAFRVARAAEEEGRGGEVVDRANAF